MCRKCGRAEETSSTGTHVALVCIEGDIRELGAGIVWLQHRQMPTRLRQMTSSGYLPKYCCGRCRREIRPLREARGVATRLPT